MTTPKRLAKQNLRMLNELKTMRLRTETPGVIDKVNVQVLIEFAKARPFRQTEGSAR